MHLFIHIYYYFKCLLLYYKPAISLTFFLSLVEIWSLPFCSLAAFLLPLDAFSVFFLCSPLLISSSHTFYSPVRATGEVAAIASQFVLHFSSLLGSEIRSSDSARCCLLVLSYYPQAFLCVNACEWLEAAEIGAMPGLDLGREISYPSLINFSKSVHSRVFKWCEQLFN